MDPSTPWQVVFEVPCPSLALGPHRFDVTHRALVMGILNRTPDSFYDRGSYCDLERSSRRPSSWWREGADILDVGGVKAGPGPEVGEAEELDRVVPAIEALHARFDVPLSVDTWRASVARAAYEAGAVVGNDISGFADPDYLPVAAEAGASVVATHIRLAPRVADPEPALRRRGGDGGRVSGRPGRSGPEAAGIPAERIMLDAGLDLGKTEPQSLVLLRASDRLAGLGYPLLLSASNKRSSATCSAPRSATGGGATPPTPSASRSGCRILRAHDVRGARRVCDVMAAILEAARPAPRPDRRRRCRSL